MIARRRVEIRWVEGDGYHVERADGSVTIAISARAAVKMVKADDRALTRRGASAVVTTIEWCDVPADFSPEESK